MKNTLLNKIKQYVDPFFKIFKAAHIMKIVILFVKVLTL